LLYWGSKKNLTADLTLLHCAYRKELCMNDLISAPIQKDASWKLPVFVDTDIGDDIDDALALALVLQSPELALEGVSTVFGDTYQRARLAAYLLQVYGRTDIPVSAGCQVPLQVRHRPSGLSQAAVLDDDSVGVLLNSSSGPDLLIRTALAHPGQLTLLCLGPLTNVAAALLQEPRLGPSLQRILLMGGASRLSLPDWNVRSDARAAQIVLTASVPVTMIGWNVTRHCHLRTQDVDELSRTPHDRLQLVSRLISAWRQHRPWWGSMLPSLHDPLVITALCAPQFFRFEQIPARVLVQGPLSGFTIPRVMGGQTVQAAVSVQGQQAQAWMMQRLLSS
jgi:purine nucleosidase